MEDKKTPAEIKKMRGQFSQRVMGFNRFHTGQSGAHAVSIYEVAAVILIKQGIVRPDGMGAKNFCAENYEIIFASQKGRAKKSRAEKKANAFVEQISSGLEKSINRGSRSKKKDLEKDVESSDAAYIASNDFLSSYEWRKVRMQALKLHGAKCMCCGDTPANGAIMNVDHIKPRKLFPSLALELTNLQILCGPCNHGKGNWDQTDWRK